MLTIGGTMRSKCLAVLSAGLLAACTAPNEGGRTVVVQFDRAVTAADAAALADVGGVAQSTITLASVITMRTDLESEAYLAVDGVAAARDLGEDENPRISVFIRVDRAPTEADLDFVRDLGAQTVSGHPDDQLIVAVMPLLATERLNENEHFTSVEIDLSEYSIDV